MTTDRLREIERKIAQGEEWLQLIMEKSLERMNTANAYLEKMHKELEEEKKHIMEEGKWIGL